VRAEKGEDLFVRGESFDKRNTGDVLFATSIVKGVFLLGFLTLDVPIIYVLISTSFQYMIQLTLILFIWATMPNEMLLELVLLKLRLMGWCY